MHFTLDISENVATLGFQEGFLDDREIRALRESVRALVTEGNTKLVIDLAEATHVNSTLIGAMVEIYTSYNKPGRHVVYARPRDSTKYLLRMLRLDQVFEIAPSLEEALNLLDQPRSSPHPP